MGAPSTSLVSTPAPANLYPGINEQFMSALTNSGIAGTAANTLNAAASGSLPLQTGPQLTAMQAALQQQQSAGAANLREQFGSEGLAESSNLGAAASSYETQSTTQMGNLLAQYQLAQQQQQIGAAEAGLGVTATPAETTFAPATLVTGPSPLQELFSGAGAAGSLFGGLATAFPSLFGLPT